MARLFPAWTVLVGLLACADASVTGEPPVPSAVPTLAPPRLAPAEWAAPRVEQSIGQRVVTRMPTRVNSTQVDMHRQSEGIVDILWIIDDSGSMDTQRNTLVGNFDRFVDELLRQKVDFQIGVTSTNAADGGRLRGATKIINNNTPDPRSVFIQNTTFASSRSRWEQGLKMAEFAITSPNIEAGGPNEGFLRANAALVLIVLSDEDDSSLGTTDYFSRVFRSAKGKGNERLVSFSSIAGTTPDGCFPPGEENLFNGRAAPAFRYEAVVQKTGGVVGSICDASFESTLTQIASGLGTLRRIFPLTLAAVPESIVVMVDGVVIPRDALAGWEYSSDNKSLNFPGSYIPPPKSLIRIEYVY